MCVYARQKLVFQNSRNFIKFCLFNKKNKTYKIIVYLKTDIIYNIHIIYGCIIFITLFIHQHILIHLYNFLYIMLRIYCFYVCIYADRLYYYLFMVIIIRTISIHYHRKLTGQMFSVLLLKGY